MTGFEWAVIILIIILIVLAVIIVVGVANLNNELNNPSCTNLSPLFPAQTVPSTFVAPTLPPQTNSFIVAGPAAGQNPQVFITTDSTGDSTNNVGSDGELGSTCTMDGDCRSQNCSQGVCQSHNMITGQHGAFCQPNGSSALTCAPRFRCEANRCTPIGNDLFELCQSNSDCKPFFVCSKGIGSDSEDSICVFKDDPNGCVDGTCSGGYRCVNSKCVGISGAPCTLNEQCVNGCSTQSITKWVDGGWSSYAPMPPEVKFNKLAAVTRSGNDDIWGLDLNRGLYYWKHDDPNQNWIKVADALFKRRIDYDGEREEKRLKIVDMAVTDQNTVYLVYKASSIDTRCDYYSPIYPIYRLNMLTALDSSSNMRERLVPFNTPSGVQWVAKSDSTFTRILSIDAILHNGQLIMMVYGNDRDEETNYTFSIIGSESDFKYSGPKSGQGFNDRNLIRFVPAPDLSATKQARLYNYLESDDRDGCNTNKIAINGRYPGTKSYGDQTIPRLASNYLIHDYVPIKREDRIETYLIASHKRHNTSNLYVSIDAALGVMYTLPGYVNMESRLAVTNRALYMYSPGTCS